MKNILIVLMIISFLLTGCNQSSDTSTCSRYANDNIFYLPG